MLANILERQLPSQRSPEWYASRELYLTSSDLGSVLGLNKYQTRHDCLLKKAGLKPNVVVDDTAIKHGQKYENEAIATYCAITGRKCHEVGLIPYSMLNEQVVVDGIDCSFLAGSADGVTTLDDDRSLNVIEVKCPLYRWPKYGKIPAHYYPQLQMNLHILNVDVGDFIEYWVPGLQSASSKMNVVRIYRDHDWFRCVLPELRAFWDEVLTLRQDQDQKKKDRCC